MKQLPTRWDYDDPIYENGIPETFSKCNLEGRRYRTFGYKGKQVRDDMPLDKSIEEIVISWRDRTK